MDWLNYHHFLYFWVVAREGTIVKAGEKLKLAHPTISGQIHRLEKSLGVKLFSRRGRNLVMTEAGQTAYRYADEIFSLGREFVDTIKGHASGKALRLIVGVADVQPPSLVRRFIKPAFELGHGIQVACRNDKSLEEFLAEVALHRIDVVIADRPVGSGVAVRAYSHLLGDCGTTFMASPEIATRLRRKFPESIDGAPFIMPGPHTAVSRSLHEWFNNTGIRAKVIAECDDGALVKELGKAGAGVFAIPAVMETEVRQQYGVAVVGRALDLRQSFYAISVERKIKHPAVAAICNAARHEIFANQDRPTSATPGSAAANPEPPSAAKAPKIRQERLLAELRRANP